LQSFDLQLSISLPENLVVIERVEYEKFLNQDLKGQWWSMKDLEERTNKKIEWLKENVLYVKRFKEVLDVNQGGFVYYPQGRGQCWSFQATRMSEFLEKNFASIYSR
jgi:phage pi2 protein 07